jgi:glycosyltransferase involved in cell wall biosynthesis
VTAWKMPLPTNHKVKICHLTTLHPVFDVRIFYKECVGLARHGYDVTLVARHDKREFVDGVRIVPIRSCRIRPVARLVHAVRALRLAMSVKAEVYHFHDPELLPAGVVLKCFSGGRVIYDVHEDVRKHTLGKMWIHPIIRPVLAFFLGMLEKCCERFFDGIIVVLESHAARFSSPTVVIHNYPMLEACEPRIFRNRDHHLIYVGLIRKQRGAVEMLETTARLKIRYPDVRLTLVGNFMPLSLETRVKDRIRDLDIEDAVRVTGRLEHRRIFDEVADADIGLALLHPDSNYLDALPTKLFEYMMLEKPVVASDFPLWKRIVDRAKCGLTVDPLDVPAIVEGIGRLFDSPDLANRMGRHGRQAVLNEYNWTLEEKKLIAWYQTLTARK